MLSPPNRTFTPWSNASPWTDEKVAQLKKMYADGVSSTRIGDVLGFSRGAISGKIDRLGLTGRARAVALRASKVRGDRNRAATMRIKTLRVRGAANGGAQLVECVVREESPQPAGFLGITFADLAKGQCKFPRGEGTGIRFCGQPQMSGEPYCRNCCGIAYNYTPPPTRPYLPTGGSKLRVF